MVIHFFSKKHPTLTSNNQKPTNKLKVDKVDEYAWCGTSTGDVMKVKLAYSKTDRKNCNPVGIPSLVGCYAKHPAVKKKNLQPDLWCLGVRALILRPDGEMIIGTGDGIVDYVSQRPVKIEKLATGYKLSNPTLPHFVVMNSAVVGGLVTSLQMLKNNQDIIVGTIKSEIYLIDVDTFEVKLYVTCHTYPIFGVAFPRHYSDVFATASENDIRVWSVSRACELLRINVPNFACSSVIFAPNGKAILSGWNDGNIRAFTPQSGKLIFIINEAHNKGVSALAMTSDCKKLLTGGIEGQVRIWEVLKDTRRLVSVLKEHKAPVTAVDIAPNDKEAVSASSDGSCIIWDIEKCVRFAILFSSTLFMAVKYHPSGCQLVTAGTNRQLGYWEVFDGSLVREIEGSKSAAINTLDISLDGKYMATGGNDTYVKVWLYKEGHVTHIGLGHGTSISAVKFSADMRTLVSCSGDGAIFIWKTPFNLSKVEPEEQKNVTEVNSPESVKA